MRGTTSNTDADQVRIILFQRDTSRRYRHAPMVVLSRFIYSTTSNQYESQIEQRSTRSHALLIEHAKANVIGSSAQRTKKKKRGNFFAYWAA